MSLWSALVEAVLPETNALLVNPLKEKPILAVAVVIRHQSEVVVKMEMKRLIRQVAARAAGSYTENTDPHSSTAGACQDAPGYRLTCCRVENLFTFTVKRAIVVTITVLVLG
jgi:hypothetical protein